MPVDFNKIKESPHLLDVLIQMEDILDSFDIYVFENWIIGEIVSGPKVRRYWFDFTLRYDIEKMPDPKGALRLLNHGIRVNFDKVTVEKNEPQTDESIENDNEPDGPTHWEVSISIPSRLISDMNSAEIAAYEDDVDSENVQDAQDSGFNEETGLVDESGDTNGDESEVG